MSKLTWLILWLFFTGASLAASPVVGSIQETPDSIPRRAHHDRLIVVAGVQAGLWAGSYVALNKAWYSEFPRSRFHFFNDNSEWGQMDKLGHIWTAYQVSRVSAETWRWTGISNKTAVLLGSASALAYQSMIEIQDGFSSEWGFSWGDMTANAIGAAGYAAQELGWKQQRILIKLSYYPYKYPGELVNRRNQLFGNTLPERILKDYNSQTYWLSANISSFLPSANLPRWLNISVGYGSELMLGGTENVWTDRNGVFHDRRDISRYRRFFLSPDIDFTRIHTRNKIVRGLLFALNTIKMPAPAFELNTKGRFKFFPVYY